MPLSSSRDSFIYVAQQMAVAWSHWKNEKTEDDAFTRANTESLDGTQMNIEKQIHKFSLQNKKMSHKTNPKPVVDISF